MKSKHGLNLPYGIYLSILALSILATVIWDKTPSPDNKDLIKYLCLIFSLATIQGAILIRMGIFDAYKNTLNAIWNIETAFVFLYGIYTTIEFSYLPLSKQPSLSKWAFDNIESFVLIVIFLSVVCVVRAGYSVAEVFKNSILKTVALKSEGSDNKVSNATKTTRRKRRKKIN